MPHDLVMPKLHAEMTAGAVLFWHKRQGASIRLGEPLVEIETGESQVTLEAPAAGVLASVAAPEGCVAGVGETLAVIALAGEAESAPLPLRERGASPERSTNAEHESGEGVQAQPGAAEEARRREVNVVSSDDSLRAEVDYGSFTGTLDADDEAGPDPVTAFLGALGSCLLMPLRVAAQARKISIDRAEVTARANEKGPVKEIKVTLKVATGADPERFARLVEVAERGCHIRAMLRDDLDFSLRAEKV